MAAKLWSVAKYYCWNNNAKLRVILRYCAFVTNRRGRIGFGLCII